MIQRKIFFCKRFKCKRNQADYIKIDGSLIKNIDKDKNSRLVVETIVIFAKKLGVKTIAEFVHSQEVLDVVRSLNIDYAQGYHLGKPEQELVTYSLSSW